MAITRRQRQGLSRVDPLYGVGLSISGASGGIDLARNSNLAVSGVLPKVVTPAGLAIQFNSGSNLITVNRSGPTLFQSSFTVLYQFRQNGVVQNGGSILNDAGGASNANALWIYTLGNGVLRADVFNSSGANTTIDSAAVLVDGQSYTVAFVFDFIAKTAKWIINGVVSGTPVSLATFTGRNAESASFAIAGPVRNFAPNHDVSLISIVPNVVSDAVCANPWQTYKAPPQPLYAIAATGVNGAIGWLEQSDTASISGSVKVTGAASWTEASDTAALAGTVGSAVTGSLGWTEQSDTTAISSTVTVTASASWTETSDTAAISATATVTGSAAWTEASDTASIAASAQVSAAASWTEQADTAAIAASVGNSLAANIAWTEQSDTASVSASVTVNASVGWTEASDTTAITANVAASTTAAISWTEQADTAAVSASLRVNAAIGWTEAPDISALPVYPQEFYFTIMRASAANTASVITNKNYQATIMRGNAVNVTTYMRNMATYSNGTFL